MKTVIIATALIAFGGFAHAEESMAEKGSATAHDAKRSMKKGMNRAKEMICAEGDAKCLAEKAKHRADETGDKIKDKTKEGMDKMDADGKPRK